MLVSSQDIQKKTKCMLCLCFQFQMNSLFINRLFFGGHWPINIEAIWLIEQAQQFDDITKSITYLDNMLFGVDMKEMKITTKKSLNVKEFVLFYFAEENKTETSRVYLFCIYLFC